MMLELKNRQAFIEPPPVRDDAEIGDAVNAVRLFVVRRYKVVLLMTALGLLAGLAYLKIERPSYTAYAGIDIVNREGRFLQQQATLADVPADVDRAIALTKSLRVSEVVSRKLDLVNDTEFDPPPSGLITNLRALWAGGYLDPDALRMRTTIAAVQNGTRVTPDPSGSAFAIGFTSHDPVKAAEIANAIADAFLSFQNEADGEVHKQAANWLVEQSDELGRRAKVAETAVAEFIKTNNIVIVDGKSLEQQKLEDVGKRVAEAKDRLVEIQYRMDRINASVETATTRDLLDATSSAEVLKDPVIARSRDRYVDLSNQVRAIQRDFGKDSQKLQELTANAKAEILTELGRLQNNVRNDYQAAGKLYSELLAEQKSAIGASQRAIYLEGQLKELQDTAQNYRTLYQNFLQHSAESVQELSFPVRAARLSERAKQPFDKSWPRPLMVLAAAALGGLALGVGSAALRDFSDRTFRTGSQLESATKLKCLGLIPKVSISKSSRAVSSLTPEFMERFRNLRGLPIWVKIKATPNSRFVSELIAVRLALRSYAASHGASVFGLTSALSGEGKSTLVASIGVLMAQSGYRLAIVDLDFRNPSLTNSFLPHSRIGLADVLMGDKTLDDVLVRDPILDLAIVPCVSNTSILRSVELLTSAKMRECIAQLRQKYDFVLIDLPPLIPVTDVRATSEFIDGYIMAVEWAKTNVALVKRAIESCPEIRPKLMGAVLNKVNYNMLSKYDAGATLYYMKSDVGRYLDNE